MTCENGTALANRRSDTRFSPVDFSFLDLVHRIAAIRKQRRALGNLDDAALKDMGLDRAEAKREAARSFWDMPANWRR